MDSTKMDFTDWFVAGLGFSLGASVLLWVNWVFAWAVLSAGVRLVLKH